MRETFRVPEVSCDHCKRAIEGALEPLDGVERAAVDVPAKEVSVDYDENVVERSSLIQAIEGAGYSVSA